MSRSELVVLTLVVGLLIVVSLVAGAAMVHQLLHGASASLGAVAR